MTQPNEGQKARELVQAMHKFNVPTPNPGLEAFIAAALRAEWNDAVNACQKECDKSYEGVVAAWELQYLKKPEGKPDGST